MEACARPTGPVTPFHIFYPPIAPMGHSPYGQPSAGQLRAVRRLRAPGIANFARPEAARNCVYRPSAGAPRRLRPRSAFPGGERYAHSASRGLVLLLWCVQQPVDASFRNVEIRILLIHLLDRESFKEHRVDQFSVGDIVSQDGITYPLSIFFNSVF